MAETNDKNERRLIRRNTSNQIVSYTLPQNSVTLYGLVKIPAQKDELNKEQFEKSIDSNVIQFEVTTPDLGLSAFELNSVVLRFTENIERPTEGSFKFKFNGDIIKVSNELYYVEDDVSYPLPKVTTSNIGFPWQYGPSLTLLSEKLDKPFLFRTTDDDPDFPNLDYQYGEPRPQTSWDSVFEVKSETYLQGLDPGFNFELTDIADPIKNSVVQFYFNLIDEINPRPSQITFDVDDQYSLFLNQNILASGRESEIITNLTPVVDGVNRIGAHINNYGGPANVKYSFKDRNGTTFRHSFGWRGQDAFSGRHGNPSGWFPFELRSINESVGNFSVNRIDGSPIQNGDGTFWLGPQTRFRNNIEYRFNTLGVRFVSVHGLANDQQMGWKPNTRGQYRYGLVSLNDGIQISVGTDNEVAPASNRKIVFQAVLQYNNKASKTITNSTRTISWNGKKVVNLNIPPTDVTDDLYRITVKQTLGGVVVSG